MIEPTNVHHQRLTVSDIERSVDFYTRVVGFRLLRQREAARVLGAGSILLVLAPPPHQATPGDRFDPNRIGLDHLCFSLPTWSDLAAMAEQLTAAGVAHSGVKDLGPEFGFGTLTFEDPDGIQLEFAAPHP